MAITKTPADALKELKYKSMIALARDFDRAERAYRTHNMMAARANERCHMLADAIQEKMADAARSY